jgi:hypothetical protein
MGRVKYFAAQSSTECLLLLGSRPTRRRNQAQDFLEQAHYANGTPNQKRRRDLRKRTKGSNIPETPCHVPFVLEPRDSDPLSGTRLTQSAFVLRPLQCRCCHLSFNDFWVRLNEWPSFAS